MYCPNVISACNFRIRFQYAFSANILHMHFQNQFQNQVSHFFKISSKSGFTLFQNRFHTFSKSGMSHFFKIRYVTLFQNQVLTKHVNRGIINFAVEEQQIVVRVAQLDRASGYGPEGREFESCHVHYYQ